MTINSVLIPHRVFNGGGLRALSTNSVRLCEKKNESVTANQDEETKTDAEADPKETETLVTQEADEDSKVIKMTEQSEEPLVSKADDGGSTTQKHQVDVTTEQDVVTPAKVETDAAMSGKESLLSLLGAMKVDVTSKRKPKIIKVKQSESTPVSRPPAMESTISMFQQATAEASSQRWEGEWKRRSCSSGWIAFLKCKSVYNMKTLVCLCL